MRPGTTDLYLGIAADAQQGFPGRGVVVVEREYPIHPRSSKGCGSGGKETPHTLTRSSKGCGSGGKGTPHTLTRSSKGCGSGGKGTPHTPTV